MSSEVAVELGAKPEPLVSRVFQIMKDRIEQRCSSIVVEKGAGAQIVLSVDDSLQPDAFRINQVDSAVRVAGGVCSRTALWCREVSPDQRVRWSVSTFTVAGDIGAPGISARDVFCIALPQLVPSGLRAGD